MKISTATKSLEGFEIYCVIFQCSGEI